MAVTGPGKSKKAYYNITLNVVVDVDRSEDGRRIPWISFKGWKHGIIQGKNRFIDTDPIVRKTDENMKYIGEHIFNAAKDMFYEDEELKSE